MRVLSQTLFDLSDIWFSSLFAEDVPVWKAIEKLQQWMDITVNGQLKGIVSPGAWLAREETIFLGEESVVETGAYIEGPCIIGKRCRIGHGAYLRPYTLLADDCYIGHASEIKHSIFLKGAKAPHFNYVGDSIVGNGVNLGAGVKCANVRVDGNPVKVRYRNEIWETGRMKFGAIIGDGVSLGCNTVTNPGTVIERGVCSGACQVLKGYVV